MRRLQKLAVWVSLIGALASIAYAATQFTDARIVDWKNDAATGQAGKPTDAGNYKAWDGVTAGTDANLPVGSVAIAQDLDNALRGIKSVIRAESLNKSWERWGVFMEANPGPFTFGQVTSTTQFKINTPNTDQTDNASGLCQLGRRVRFWNRTTGVTIGASEITAASFAAAATTVTIMDAILTFPSTFPVEVEFGPPGYQAISGLPRLIQRQMIIGNGSSDYPAKTGLDVRTGIAFQVNAIGTTSGLGKHNMIVLASGTITLTLPAATNTGQVIIIVKQDINAVTLATNTPAAEGITVKGTAADTTDSVVLASGAGNQWGIWIVVADGTSRWHLGVLS